MKILFYDAVQDSDAPAKLKSPALADFFVFEENGIKINFNNPVIVDCIGLGNCGVAEISIILTSYRRVIDGGRADTGIFGTAVTGGTASSAGTDVTDGSESAVKEISADLTGYFSEGRVKDGLYLLEKSRIKYASVEIIAPKGTEIGRLALGKAVNVPTSVVKEPGYHSTAEPRRTLSGQIVEGAGGYSYRTLSLDSRYKIGPEAFGEIEAGKKSIGKGHPFFIDLRDEAYKLTFDKLYAVERNQRAMGFEGGIKRFLYSRRWEFEEAF